MKRLIYLLFYIGAAAILCDVLLRLFHQRHAGVLLFGVLMVFAGELLVPFVAAEKWKAFLLRQKVMFSIVWAGLVLVPLGLIMKIVELPGYNWPCIIGFALLLIYFTYYIAMLLRPTLTDKPIGKPLSNEELTRNEMAATDLKQYEGRYTNSKSPLQIAITVRDGALIAQATEQSAFYLEVVEKGVFKYWKRDIVLDFNTEKNELILRQHGGYFPFLKEPESAN